MASPSSSIFTEDHDPTVQGSSPIGTPTYDHLGSFHDEYEAYQDDLDVDFLPLSSAPPTERRPSLESCTVERASKTEEALARMAPVESLQYEETESRILQKRRKRMTEMEIWRQRAIKWAVTGLIGVCIGVTSYLIQAAVRLIKRLLTTSSPTDGRHWAAFSTMAAFNVALVTASAFLVSYVEPVCSASGIAEIKGYLNGVNFPRLLRMKTGVVKVVGLILASSGGLIVGREAPMLHIGTIIAAGISYGSKVLNLDVPFLRRFRNDHDKRDFVSSGAAGGVAAAFGAPISGVLFSLEQIASWSTEVTWQTFFCAVCSTFTLNLLLSGFTGNLANPGLITLYVFHRTEQYRVLDIIPIIIMGVFGGILGAFFNFINIRLWRRRQRIMHSPSKRTLEAVGIALLTVSCQFWIPMMFPCRTTNEHEDIEKEGRFNCPKGKYNDMAMLFSFFSAESTIKELFSRDSEGVFRIWALLAFLLLVFFLAVITHGLAVPCGLVIPSLLIGCAYGRLFGRLVGTTMPWLNADPGTYALVGSASMLAGVTRGTLSLTVRIVELTNDLQYILPVMLAVLAAKYIGDRINKSIYESLLDENYIPFVPETPPNFMQRKLVSHVMTGNVKCFRDIERVDVIVDTLRSSSHNGFPIISPGPTGHGRVLHGFILRSQLMVLLRKRIFQDNLAPDRSQLSRHLSIRDFVRPVKPHRVCVRELLLDEEDLEKYVNLTPYMDLCPHIVPEKFALHKAYMMFRTLGLRHLVVVDANYREVVGIVTRKDLWRTLHVHAD